MRRLPFHLSGSGFYRICFFAQIKIKIIKYVYKIYIIYPFSVYNQKVICYNAINVTGYIFLWKGDRNLTIHDIARALGVSSATVSRVINHSGYVKEETQKKIEQFIRENNYTPSAVARSLSKQDTSSIGVIIPDIENSFFSGVIRGISEIAEKNGYNILFFGTNENPGIEHRFLNTVKEQRLKGVIITPASNHDDVTRDFLVDLDRSGVPVVLVDRDLHHSNFDGVFVDNFQGAYDAVETFLRLGHERIAIIAGPETSKPGKERLEGYLSAMNRLGGAVREQYIARGDFKVEMGYELTGKLLSVPVPPTAIFSSNNLMTIGCLKYLVEKNYRLGSDISVIGFDDIDILNYVGFRLSVVSRAVSEMGTAAMDILLERLENPRTDDNARRIVFPTSLVLRGSEKIMKKHL